MYGGNKIYHIQVTLNRKRHILIERINQTTMAWALIIALIFGGTFFFLWQEEHEKFIKAEKQIKDLRRQLKRQQGKLRKTSSGFATIEKSKGVHEYIIKKPQSQPVKPLLDPNRLAELQMQTRASQDILAEIFAQEEDASEAIITISDNGSMQDVLTKLFEKEVWTRNEIAKITGPDVMIGNLLEQINDYSCSKIDDIVVEDDGDKIYVTTEYKTQLI